MSPMRGGLGRGREHRCDALSRGEGPLLWGTFSSCVHWSAECTLPWGVGGAERCVGGVRRAMRRSEESLVTKRLHIHEQTLSVNAQRGSTPPGGPREDLLTEGG